MSTETSEKVKQRTFMIHNTVRRHETRIERAKAAQHPRMNLLLGGGAVRVVRGKYAVVTERVLMRLLRELHEKEKVGALKVTDMQRRRVDLATLQLTQEVVVEEKPTPAPPPHPPLDSAKNDKTFEHGVGIPMPQKPGMKGETEELKVPGLLGGDVPPADESEELSEGVDLTGEGEELSEDEQLERMLAEEEAAKKGEG